MRLFPVPLLVLCGALSVAAQSSEPLKTKALSFGFNGLNLGGVNGGIGGKMWISSQQAVTLNVSGAYSSQLRKAIDSTRIDEEQTNSEVNLVVGMEQHADLGRGFSPYVMGGLSIGYGYSESRDGSTTNPYRYENRATLMGVRAGVGLEYWLTPRVSVAGQQLVMGNYSFGTYRSGTASLPSRDMRQFSFGLGTSSLILSVYL
jgi:opacity protein-like surface antigen